MVDRIRLYFSFAGISLRARMMDRGAFIAGFIGQFVSYGATFLTTWFMVMAFDSLGGWNASEVLFFYGFNVLAYALAASVFFTPTKTLTNKIRTGEFDASLTKPMHPLMHEIYLGFNSGYIAHVALALFAMAASGRGAGFSAGRIPVLLWMLAGAVLVYAAWFLAQSAGAFFLVRDNAFAALLWQARDFVEYPITIYSTAIQTVLTFVLPFAFMNFYPVAAVLGLSTATPFPAWLPWCTPLVGAALFGLSVKLWNWSMAHYKSTGT